MFAPIKRRKLFREIANEIAKSIRHGTYTIGDELPSEREMMRDFAVGRPAVREALLILEAQGLVAIRHGRRARVTTPANSGTANWIEVAAGLRGTAEKPFVENLKELRLALEVAMAARAAEIADSRDLAKLKAALEANRIAIPSREAYLRSDIALHRTIAAITRNPLFEEMAGAILEWLSRYRTDVVHVDGANLLSHREHEAICSAIIARNPLRAAEQMRRHQLRTHALYGHIIAKHDNGKTKAAPRVSNLAKKTLRRK